MGPTLGASSPTPHLTKMRGLTQREKIPRDKLLALMKQIPNKLKRNSAAHIAGHEDLKEFLVWLAREAPKESKKILGKASRIATDGAKEVDTEKKTVGESRKRKAELLAKEIFQMEPKRAKAGSANEEVGEAIPRGRSATVSADSGLVESGC